MAFRIGFSADSADNGTIEEASAVQKAQTTPRRSVVRVCFPERNMKLAYYNDSFDLHCGDLVYVDGKLEGIRGRVVDVNYNFKIKVSDYKRVIAVIDTDVHGKFYNAADCFVTFEREALPSDKAVTWFKAPDIEDEEYVCGNDDKSFNISDLTQMDVRPEIAERGHDYYINGRVRYISLDGAKGFAIVEGSESYEVEFEYRNGQVSNLTCSCFCSFNCKHEFAAMLQLREMLDIIEKNYMDKVERTGYFAAITKGAFFSFAIDGKEKLEFTV